MQALGPDSNFLALEDPAFYSYENARFVIQQLPYEHTSSYLQGSAKGPAAILSASHFVEFYDEELDRESFRSGGIATLPPLDFTGKFDKNAVDLIEQATDKLIADEKFVVSLGAEHTITFPLVKSHVKKHGSISVLQLDAHSDLRHTYHDNLWSHASVMARVNELGLNIVQIGIRAQCKEEAELIRKSPNIHTFYAHQVRRNPNWMEEALNALGDKVYLTVDADGFDPSVIPCVGTAEPNGLYWDETIRFLSLVASRKTIVGFDVVEVAPCEGQILSEFTLAKLVYKLIGLITSR